MKRLCAVIGAATLALLTACADAPTRPRPDPPGGPARGGGHGFGSGNVVPTDTAASTTATDRTGSTSEPAESTQERGGMGYGSGN